MNTKILSRALSTIGPNAKVGFIGLGNMGGFMAANLLKGGNDVTVFDTSTEAVDKLVNDGAKKANTIKEVGEYTDVVILMLPSCPIVSKVCLEDGLFEGLKEGSIIIDSSTINPTVSRQLNKKAKEKDITFIDAPVSGGVTGAENGTLTFMVGADSSGLMKATPYLEQMGKNIVGCGDSGSGLVAKICNNMLLSIQMIGVAEAMNLGKNLGMDEKKLAQIINTSTGRCWSSDSYNPVPGVMEGVPSAKEYNGGFGCSLMLKDVRLAIQAAEETQSKVTLGSQSEEIYKTLCEVGYGHKDFGAIYDYLAPAHRKVI